MIHIFIGYDPLQDGAFDVLAHSITVRSSRPVDIRPIKLQDLRDVYRRPRDPLQSTDFSFSRFLAPFLCKYDGWCIFMDCDMLMLDDIAALWQLRDSRYCVQVVKHNHIPDESRKFLDFSQTKYLRKNWSSLMMMNNSRCRALTPDYVNQAHGLDLHQFKWVENDSLIGGIPKRWNHLVGFDPPCEEASLIHFTEGGPWFEDYQDCEYAREWFAEAQHYLRTCENH